MRDFRRFAKPNAGDASDAHGEKERAIGELDVPPARIHVPIAGHAGLWGRRIWEGTTTRIVQQRTETDPATLP